MPQSIDEDIFSILLSPVIEVILHFARSFEPNGNCLVKLLSAFTSLSSNIFPQVTCGGLPLSHDVGCRMKACENLG